MDIVSNFDMNKYRVWYKDVRVLKSLVYQMRYREGAILGTNLFIRNMKIRNPSHLIENMRCYNLFGNAVNWYYSLAILKEMPVFSFNPDERKIISKEFDENFEIFMSGYDWALDFDAKDTSFEVAYSDMKKVHEWMKDKKVPHSVRCSGTGFHIVVYSLNLWNPPFRFRPKFGNILCSIMGKALADELSLESLDKSIYDKRRIFKVPYSMDIRSGNICRPLTEGEIKSFDYKLVSPEYCLDNVNTFYINMFPGDCVELHKWIFSIFKGYCNSTFDIYRRIEKLKYKAYPKESKDEYLNESSQTLKGDSV